MGVFKAILEMMGIGKGKKGGVVLAGLAVVAILVLIIWWWNSRRVATPTAPSPIPAARYSRPTTDTLPLTNRPPRK